MFQVSIYSQTNKVWRTIEVATMTDCVRLTIGLTTEWKIRSPKHIFNIVGNSFWIDAPIGGSVDLLSQYGHSKRALICSWIKSIAKQRLTTENDRDYLRFAFRLSDCELVKQIKSERTFAEQPIL